MNILDLSVHGSRGRSSMVSCVALIADHGGLPVRRNRKSSILRRMCPIDGTQVWFELAIVPRPDNPITMEDFEVCGVDCSGVEKDAISCT